MTTAYVFLIVSNLVSITLGILTWYRNGKPLHQNRQKYRIEYDGWTLPWWICGLYWIGAERLAPRRLRRTR